jgi:hypothetical protein
MYPARWALIFPDNFVPIEPSTRQTQMTVSILIARELETALEHGIIPYQRFFQASLNVSDPERATPVGEKVAR